MVRESYALLLNTLIKILRLTEQALVDNSNYRLYTFRNVCELVLF